jgi:WD40 repeat protein
VTKDGSNARKQAARELAAAERIPYTEALRRIDQRSGGTPAAADENTAATGTGRVTRIRLTPPATTITTDAVLIGHTGHVNSVAFHPDGRTLASSGDVTVRLWDLATRQTSTVLTGETEVIAAALSPDGRTLAVAYSEETVTLWAIATGQITDLTGSDGQVRSVAFSPDSRTLATTETPRWQPGQTDPAAVTSTIRLWDLATGQTTTTLTPHGGYVVSLAFSPDGRTLASAGTDSTVRLWDPATGQATATLFGHTEFVTSVAFSPDGRTLASGSMDKTVRLWTLG